MLNPWNDLSLEPPPNNTFVFVIDCPVDLRDFSQIFSSIKKVLSKQLPLHNEGALLSRLIYKFDKKFRNDIGYRNLRKVNTAMHKYLSLNLLKDIENFMSLLPKDKEENFLPSKQMLEYILVRIMSFSMIMKRICITSKLTAIYYMDRVKRGESHWMSLMPFALLSRIWSLSKVLLQHSCSWYSHLYLYLDKLQVKGIEFLPTGYLLPTDFEQWLDIENIDCSGRFQWYCKKNVPVKFNFAEDDDVNLDSILDYVKEVYDEEKLEDTHVDALNDKLRLKAPLKITNSEIKNIDEGQSISREYFQSFFTQSNKVENKKVHSADVVTNKTTLVAFIANEEEYRNQDSNQSLTSHLSFMQWQSLKKSLLQLSESLSNNRKIERKFKKIWKEKCLDYI